MHRSEMCSVFPSSVFPTCCHLLILYVVVKYELLRYFNLESAKSDEPTAAFISEAQE